MANLRAVVDQLALLLSTLLTFHVLLAKNVPLGGGLCLAG
jgi:hypothetical protein